MPVAQVTREAVLAALVEYDKLGRVAFLRKYGFGESRRYMLQHEGRLYDSKAVLGVAHKYAFPELGVMHSSMFSGGVAVVRQRLRELGFAVVRAATAKHR